MNKTVERIADGGGSWMCLCGNEPTQDGFYSAMSDGSFTSPSIGGKWDDVSYTCARCSRIINGITLEVVGVCSEAVAQRNENFDWETY